MDRGVFEAAVRRSLYGSVSDADNLFARGVDGDYKQPDVQFAWWAFQIGGARVADSLTSKKLESVARAICLGCEEDPEHIGDACGNKKRWEDYLPIARAAIAALKKSNDGSDDSPYQD